MSEPSREPGSRPRPESAASAAADEDLLAALADDFAARVRRNERPGVEEYAAKHPALAERIRNVLQAVALMEESRWAEAVTAGEGPGGTIGRYRLIERLGEGGFGVVYMAEQQHPVRRRVALKVIKPGMDSRQVIARFEAERQALAMMDHPHIAKVFDAGATDTGRPYFVMELVNGVPVTDYCDENNLSPRQRLGLFVQVCHAVQHAHQKGVIHRDLKPTNVLVTLHDGRPVPKVIDFGIAKATGQQLTEKTLFTNVAQMVGTPLYMSPEQAELSGLDADTRSDVYSLGVLLYELLTGTTPFDRDRLKKAVWDEVRRIIREEQPPRPSTRIGTLGAALTAVSGSRATEPKKLGPLLRGELDCIVMKALEKDRTRRYDTAHGLAMDVQRYLNNEAVIARPPSAAYNLQKSWRRNKLAFGAAATVLCVLTVGAVVSTWQAVRATRAEREQSRLRRDADGLRATEAALRRQAEEARATEATLRQQAEGRETLVKALALCEQRKFGEAEELMNRIPDSTLRTAKRDAGIVSGALTDFHARHLRWEQALRHATKAVEYAPKEENYYPLLILLAAQGDLVNYRLYCRESLVRFKDIVNGEGIAKVCLMLPAPGVDLALTDIMADRGVTSRTAEGDPFIPYSQCAKGLAEYRQGRFVSAAEWTRKSIADPFYGAGHSRYVQSYMVLAMALYRSNEPEKARAAFAEGDAIRQSKLPAVDSGDLGPDWYWRDWVVAHVLMKEAEALLQGRSEPGDPKPEPTRPN